MAVDNEAYRSVSHHVGLADRTSGRRLRLVVAGPDRVKFLHNVTTNDVKRLAVGSGCEAFVTSSQGKTLAFVTLLVGEDRILLRSDEAAVSALEPHFAKYGVFDEITLDDTAGRTFELHLAGPRTEELLAALGLQPPSPGELNHAVCRLDDQEIRIIRESPTGHSGVTLIGDRAGASALSERLRRAGEPLGLRTLDPATFDVLRIEAGTPIFGRDITPENLPQEVGRDRRAIDFVKGCYLGQETVARIDALGHVNKILRGFRLSGDGVPPPRTALLAPDGKAVGTLTSVAISPGLGQAIALGYVRTAHSQPGSTLTFEHEGARGVATVADLPMRLSA